MDAKKVVWSYGGRLVTDCVLEEDFTALTSEIALSGGKITAVSKEEIDESDLTYTGGK